MNNDFNLTREQAGDVLSEVVLLSIKDGSCFCSLCGVRVKEIAVGCVQDDCDVATVLRIYNE